MIDYFSSCLKSDGFLPFDSPTSVMTYTLLYVPEFKSYSTSLISKTTFVYPANY